MSHILLLGGTGQVGFELQRQLCLSGEVHAPGRRELDLTDAASVDAWLNDYTPGLIVNAAAYTAVDHAEKETRLAKRLNSELPAQLATFAATHAATLVHYSSDYVYAGNGEAPWHETDTPAPINVYGRTKLAGDKAIQGSGCRHLIFRTSWVYSAHGRNFMHTMLRLGREREALSVVNDQIGAPTPARLIALVTQRALTRNIDSGLYHLAPHGETSWHGFACEIFRQARARGEPLTIAPEHVSAIPTADYPTPAKRPLNSRLAPAKLEQALGITLPDWQEQLALTLEEQIASSLRSSQ